MKAIVRNLGRNVVVPLVTVGVFLYTVTSPGRTEAQFVAPLPADFHEERIGEVVWRFPAGARTDVRHLQKNHSSWWHKAQSDLGQSVAQDLEVIIARNPSEMKELAPREAPPPAYAAAVAYPKRGLVLLSYTAPNTWNIPDLEALYVHELTHVVLARAVDHHPVPRWFTEGLAVSRSREHNLARFRTLTMAVMGKRLHRLTQLSGHFPSRPHDVNIAYAQSASFVSYLQSERADRQRFQALVKHLRQGRRFEDAMHESYHVSLDYLEREWRAGLSHKYRLVPLFLSGSGVWLLAIILLAIGYVRNRRRHAIVLEQWAQEEEALDNPTPTAHGAVAPPLPRPSEPPAFHLDIHGHGPAGRDTPVPTIHVDGEDHTLH